MNDFLVWLEYNRATNRTCRQVQLAVSRTKYAYKLRTFEELQDAVLATCHDDGESATMLALWESAAEQYQSWVCGVWRDHMDEQEQFRKMGGRV